MLKEKYWRNTTRMDAGLTENNIAAMFTLQTQFHSCITVLIVFEIARIPVAFVYT